MSEPTSFFENCRIFFNSELIERLQSSVDRAILQHNHRIVARVSFIDGVAEIATGSETGTRLYDIGILLPFLHRLAILAKCNEMHYETQSTRGRVFVFDVDHPNDSHVWDYVRDDEYPFALQPGFKKFISKSHSGIHENDYYSFVDEFNSGTEAGFLDVGFKLDQELTDYVKDKVVGFALFLCFHELAHFCSNHAIFLQRWPYQKLDRSSAIAGRIFRYRHKAIEVDADVKAVSYLFDDLYGQFAFVAQFQRVLEYLAFGFSLFDLDRRNTFDSKSRDGLYPLPEIRFDFVVYMFAGWTEHLKGLRDIVMTQTIRDFQNIGICAGPFYLYSGPIASLDRQTTKEAEILESVRAEIKKIVLQLNEFFTSEDKDIDLIPEDFPLSRIGLSSDDFTKEVQQYVLKIMRGELPEATEMVTQDVQISLKELKESLLRAGDEVHVAQGDSAKLRPEQLWKLKISS